MLVVKRQTPFKPRLLRQFNSKRLSVEGVGRQLQAQLDIVLQRCSCKLTQVAAASRLKSALACAPET